MNGILKVTRAELLGRLKGHGVLSYVTIYNFMKGIALANAAYTFALLVGFGQSHGPFEWLTLTLWLASFAAVILTYYATMVGMIVILWVPTLFDIVLPFVLVIAEFSLFSVLQSPATVVYWPLVFSVFNAIVSGIVWNVHFRLRHLQIEDDVRTLVDDYRRGMKRDATLSGLNVPVMLVLFYFSWIWISGLVALVVLCLAIREQSRHAAQITKQLAGATAAQPRPAPTSVT